MRPPEQIQRAIETHAAQAADFAASYDGRHDPYESCFAYSRWRLQELLDRLLPPASPGARAADIGCGPGHHMRMLQARGFTVAGVDGAAAMLERAQERMPGVALAQARVGALPFASGCVDLVVCIEVLRYLPDPLPCLEEISRILRPGGVCLATAAPLLSLNGFVLVNRLAARLPFLRLVRLRQFFTTSRRLRRLCQRAGLRSVDVHGVYVGPVNWVERLVPAQLPKVLRHWAPWDRRLADGAGFKEIANMFLVRSIKGS